VSQKKRARGKKCGRGGPTFSRGGAEGGGRRGLTLSEGGGGKGPRGGGGGGPPLALGFFGGAVKFRLTPKGDRGRFGRGNGTGGRET